MDYEKKYKEAIELMKDCIPDADGLVHVRPQDIFPELEESEDERIREAMIDFFKHEREEGIVVLHYGVNIESMIAWLEKQGEKKAAIEMKTPEESLGIDSETYSKIVDECIYGEQKPATWSEEDETYLDHIITAIKSYYTDDNGKENPWREELLRWLKSFRERYTWKPSDEQLDALYDAAVYIDKSMFPHTKGILMKLYKQLEKLREE